MRLLAHRTLVDAARQYYAQPHRAYHDAHHLDELIALAREHTPDLDEAEQLALLFHDAVYLPGAPRGDNERRSAALMPLGEVMWSITAMRVRLPIACLIFFRIAAASGRGNGISATATFAPARSAT